MSFKSQSSWQVEHAFEINEVVRFLLFQLLICPPGVKGAGFSRRFAPYALKRIRAPSWTRCGACSTYMVQHYSLVGRVLNLSLFKTHWSRVTCGVFLVRFVITRAGFVFWRKILRKVIFVSNMNGFSLKDRWKQWFSEAFSEFAGLSQSDPKEIIASWNRITFWLVGK